uniref:Polyketide synthase n=1 Tax=Peronospora matthiolae TaxID=2874970 RepID=A0AAV1V781_9STRA
MPEGGAAAKDRGSKSAVSLGSVKSPVTFSSRLASVAVFCAGEAGRALHAACDWTIDMCVSDVNWAIRWRWDNVRADEAVCVSTGGGRAARTRGEADDTRQFRKNAETSPGVVQ